MLLNLALLALTLLGPLSLPAKTVISINSYSGFNSGTGTAWDAGQQYGQLAMAAACGPRSDEFDQAFLKGRWNPSTPVLGFSNGAVSIKADGSAYYGLQSNDFATPSSLTLVARVKPYAPNNTVGLYVTGWPWTSTHYDVYAEESNQICQIYVSYFDGSVTRCGTSALNGNTQWVTLRIIKSGNSFTAAFKDDNAADFTDVVSSTNTASMDLGPNMNFGLGFITCTACSNGGSADVDFVRLYPLASHASWTSASLDRGGVPVAAGSLSISAQVPNGAGLALFSQSSADASAWSPWQAQPMGALLCPLQRYVRLRAEMDATPDLSSGPVISSLSISQSDQDGSLLPDEQFKVLPNPVRQDKVLLRYVLSRQASEVKVEIYDASHRRVASLDGPSGLGEQRLTWNAAGFANGVYFARVTAWDGSGGLFQASRKIALLR
jgi:hypothetical protein